MIKLHGLNSGKSKNIGDLPLLRTLVKEDQLVIKSIGMGGVKDFFVGGTRDLPCI